ncbi:hypothetical protein WJN01_00085 [Flavobacteriaceae bacterium SZ-1-7]|uniref:hypothetical protein n=1 Tax=Tamlana sedimenti TaxID=3134126 RepID=UPI0031219FC8
MKHFKVNQNQTNQKQVFGFKKCIATCAMLFSVWFVLQAQTVRYVDNNQGAPTASGLNYTSVQAAVNASAAGDIIYIQPSPNGYGDINMTKQLSIYGLGHNPSLNAGQVATVNNILFRSANASGSKISGLNIYGIYLDNGTYDNHDIVITNNRIVYVAGNSTTSKANNVIISGNFFYHDSSVAIDNVNSQNWIISNNTFTRTNAYWDYEMFFRFNNTTLFNNNIVLSHQNGDNNQRIEIFRSCSGTQISNNIFLFRGTSVSNFNLGSNSALNFQNNLTYGFNSTLDALSGTNNIDNADPQFVNFVQNSSLNNSNNDYHIQGGSPAENAGTDGNNLGVFNGNYPFSIRGYPTELPYLTDFVIYNNIISAGTSLNINVKANANINN